MWCQNCRANIEGQTLLPREKSCPLVKGWGVGCLKNYDYSPLLYRLVHAMVQPALETRVLATKDVAISAAQLDPCQHTQGWIEQSPRVRLPYVHRRDVIVVVVVVVVVGGDGVVVAVADAHRRLSVTAEACLDLCRLVRLDLHVTVHSVFVFGGSLL